MAMSDKEMTCAWAHEIVEGYLDGDVPADEAAKLESHLLSCQTCAEELALAKRVRLALRDLPEQRCPDSVADAVLEQVGDELAAAQQPEPRFWRGRWYQQVWRLAAVTAAVLAMVIVATPLNRSQPPQFSVSPQELARAEQQVRWTLAYIGEIGRRSAFTVHDDVFESRVVPPIQRALTGILETEATS